jgi:CheY-like chemotaxis protein
MTRWSRSRSRGPLIAEQLDLQEVTHAVSSSKMESEGVPASDSGNCSVLLVEDNIVNQKVVALMLSKWNIEPVIAERGDVALNKVKEQSFDLILMDFHMPGMHGVDCASQIREILGEKCPPIAQGAFLKEHGQERAKAMAEAAGTTLGKTRPPKKR